MKPLNRLTAMFQSAQSSSSLLGFRIGGARKRQKAHTITQTRHLKVKQASRAFGFDLAPEGRLNVFNYLALSFWAEKVRGDRHRS